MKKAKKLTRKLFCSIYSDMAKLRRKDPIQFSVLFNDWVRLRQRTLFIPLLVFLFSSCQLGKNINSNYKVKSGYTTFVKK